MLTRTIALAFLTVSLGFSQGTTATLDGIIRDRSGAVIPGAMITVTNTRTGVSSKATTNLEGDFVAPCLLPGEYRAVVEKQGFKKVDRTGITLSVGDTIRIEFTLEVGAMTESTTRSEEHTSVLQLPCNLVCRLLLEKKKNKTKIIIIHRAYMQTPRCLHETCVS